MPGSSPSPSRQTIGFVGTGTKTSVIPRSASCAAKSRITGKGGCHDDAAFSRATEGGSR